MSRLLSLPLLVAIPALANAAPVPVGINVSRAVASALTLTTYDVNGSSAS